MRNDAAPHLMKKIKIYKTVSRYTLAVAACISIIISLIVKSIVVIDCTENKIPAYVFNSSASEKSFSQIPMENLIYEVHDNIPAENTGNTPAVDLSRHPASGELYISNETGYNPDLVELLSAPYPIKTSNVITVNRTNEPLVLILHTHGTEAFEDDSTRSEDITRNIVSIGALMAQVLNNAGINTLHCQTMHDKESYLNSYNRSKETILSYINEYPSIQYIFDVHRDAIFNSSGEAVKPVTAFEGKNVAQIMSVVGTDYKGADHPNWKSNLNLAVKLQYALNTKYANIARPINLRSASFNEQYRSGSLLLEIGSAANTLAEAERAAILTAQTLAELINNH